MGVVAIPPPARAVAAKPVAWGGFGASLRLAWPGIVLYAATRVLMFVVLLIWSRKTTESVWFVLGEYDATHYVLIADHGYDAAPDGKELAFFPLFPWLIRAAGLISPFSSRSNAIVLGLLASLFAAWGIFAVGNHLFDQWTGLLLAGLWGVVPHALVQSMAYTESLFTALAAFALVALLRRSWVTAGLLTIVAGLCRPSALALIGVVGLAALIAVVRRQDGWRPYAAALLAPLGWLGYLWWVGTKTGRIDGWFHVQATSWHSSFDFGVSTYQAVVRTATSPTVLDFVIVSLVLIGAVVLLVIAALKRVPWPLVVYSLGIVVMAVGATNYFNAKGRLILPAFALLIPIARALARLRPALAALLLTLLATTSAAFAGYLAFIWPLSP